MDSLLLLLICAALAVFIYLPRIVQSRSAGSVTQSCQNLNGPQDVKNPQPSNSPRPGETKRDWLLQHNDNSDYKTCLYKGLYFRVQNLEYHPDILPEARRTLFGLLHEGLSIEQDKPRQSSILDIETYSAESLQNLLRSEHEGVTAEWEKYVDRRARGGTPELFSSRQSAVEWVKKQAPVKLVDGAWLGHVHKITTPFALRGVTKDAWQVLSEELGDGDLEKNHVFIYVNLLKEVGVNLPSSHDADFVHPRHEMGDDLIWKASTAQLLISLFPHEFLPEILGFNLHYELLTIETLKAARELPEFGISGYYFALHVSIDNGHSGHTAIALGTVTNYLKIVREQDPAVISEIWRRIQAGYILSKTSKERPLLSDKERSLADMLRLKADATHQIHCSSRVKVSGQTLAQWLSPDTWTNAEDSRRDFLRALSNARPWVIRGDCGNSLLMRELAWNGRMFGAFTNREVEDLKAWIGDLENTQTNYEKRYWTDVQALGRIPEADASRHTIQDLTAHHPVLLPQLELHSCSSRTDLAAYDWTSALGLDPLDITNASPDTILPLWFAHPCLLENMVNTPHRMATHLVSHVIRVLRAESGFQEEGLGVAGMDEQLGSSGGPSLISLGLEMNERLGRPRPANMRDVFEASTQVVGGLAITFSKTLLSIPLRPIQNETLLIGLALVFLDLEEAVAENSGLLSLEGQQALRQIVVRKRTALNDCLDTLSESKSKRMGCAQQYLVGRSQVADALRTGGVTPGAEKD